MSFKAYSEKSKAKRALAKIGDTALANAGQLLHMGDDGTGTMKWGFNEAEARKVEAQLPGFAEPEVAAPVVAEAPVDAGGPGEDDGEVPDADDSSVEAVAAPNMFANMGAALTGSQVIPTGAAATQARAASQSSYTIEKNRPEQNGVRRPSAGGLCRAVWDACDDLRTQHNAVPTSEQVKAVAAEKGWNPNNATIEFYQWRKFNGIAGRTAKAVAPVETAAA